MVQTRAGAWRHKLVVGVLLSTMVLAAVWQSPASADVTAVEGSAYGHSADVTLFGAQQTPVAPAPQVELPPGGSATPLTDSAPSASVIYGPATLFTSGPLTVTTEGTTGPSGSVTSTADIDTINTSEQEVFTAGNLASTCTASEAGVTGSTTVTNGVIQTSEGDPDVDGDEVFVDIPANPAPNTAFEGQIETVGDSFRYVFNEQIVEGDTITVNALHAYLLGPTAVGDLIIGQSVCGITSDGNSTTSTTEPNGSTTTTDGNGGATTTTSGNGGGSTTTTMGNGGSTTTTMGNGGGSTTTTMGNGGGTTTTTQPDPGPGDCERPTDFVGGLIFDIFRGISDLLANLGITGFEDFGCDDDDDSGSDFDDDFGFGEDVGDDVDDEDDEDTDDEDTDTGAGASLS